MKSNMTWMTYALREAVADYLGNGLKAEDITNIVGFMGRRNVSSPVAEIYVDRKIHRADADKLADWINQHTNEQIDDPVRSSVVRYFYRNPARNLKGTDR